ncbi:jhamt [Trichonephila clavata]|uniref:Jhamt n=1 Tax=Trichonephila clavata TaxID=2740835 RepID=A0A8X6I0B7_TRICU|nr:jhamt [Trichonephila clavata]
MTLHLSSELYYKKHNPFESVKLFFSEVLVQLGWNKNNEKEVVMDVGCGPGRTTTEQILPLFHKLEKIYAIDLLPDMIDIARKQNYHLKIEYIVANIEDWSTIQQWKEQMTKVVSIHCFHCRFYTTILKLKENPKWKRFFIGVDDSVPDSHHQKYDALFYKKRLESIGFEVLHCKKEVKIDVFSSDEDIKNFFTSLCVLTPHVPLDRKEDFQNDLLEELLRHNGRDSNGRPYHDGKILELVVRKK